jgi:hypothetical protein
VGALFVSACGKPAYTYVSNKDANTYFKVPSDWQQVKDTAAWDLNFAHAIFRADNEDSEAFDLFKKVRWVAQFDSDTGPLVYGMVTPVPPDYQGDISLDWMRNMFAPVTTSAQIQRMASGQGLPPGFELLNDQVLTPEPGFRGVRVVYNAIVSDDRTGASFLLTYDLTAITNNDSSMLYTLLAICSAQCYRKQATKINDVVTSFTVRKAP